jgi:hypothetical protein
MRVRHITEVFILVSFITLGCSSSDGTSGTTGRTMTLRTRVDIKDDLTKPIPNALGWEVVINEAYLSVGAFYYYSGDPVISQQGYLREPNPRRNAFAWLSDFFIAPAYAHPGHYIEGAAMGQMLESTTIDLLEKSIELADGVGVTGLTNSARITWQSPPKGKLANRLDGRVVLTRGTATKETTVVYFIAQATANDVVNGDGKAEVAGCAFGAEPGKIGVNLDGDGTVTLTLVPSVWFDQVDFAYVTPEATDPPSTDAVIDIAGTLAWEGFLRGFKKGTAYEFSYAQ